MSDNTSLPQGPLLRFVNLDNVFVAADGNDMPTANAFVPTSGDIRMATEKTKKPTISVWDLATISTNEVQSRLTDDKPRFAFKFDVSAIDEVRTKCSWPTLKLVPDFIDDDPTPPKGSHWGIEGLERPKGTPKELIGQVRTALAALCTKLEADPSDSASK